MVFVNRVLGAVPETETLLSDIEEGQIVKIAENGTPVEFYVAKHDYESGLNGAGRTLLVRKREHSSQVWAANKSNYYNSSDIDTWLNSTYKNLLNGEIQDLIGTTKFYCSSGGFFPVVTTLDRAIFILSMAELGVSDVDANVEGSILPIADLLRTEYTWDMFFSQWTRSCATNQTNPISAWMLSSAGTASSKRCDINYGARPCFTLPSTTKVSDDMTITG